jgi:multiple sugar transport system substrate-binding protein
MACERPWGNDLYVSADGLGERRLVDQQGWEKMEINHPKNREAYAHYLKMLNMGCVPKNVAAWDWPDKQDGFLAGDIAMIGTGNFMINVVKDHLDKVDPGYTPFFSKDGSRKSGFVGGDLIAIPATTGNKEAALEYINFVLSREGQVDVSTKSGSIPIRSDLFDDNPYLTEDHLVFARASAVGDVPYTPVYQEMMNPWSATNQRIFAGEDLDKVLSEQNAAMQRIIDAGHN